MRKRDEADGPHRQLEDRVDEAIGEPVDTDDGRAEEETHQEGVAAAVHEASDVREEHTAREADEVAGMGARKAQVRPPVADRPQEDERDAPSAELLRDERPHARSVQGEGQARDASGESRDIRAHGELPELELALQMCLLDDREPGHDHEDRHHLDDRLELRHVVQVRPPAGQSEAHSGEEEAPHDIDPERGVEVLPVELLPLDDRRQEALLQEEVDHGEVDERHRDDPERLGAENGREDDGEGHRDRTLAPAQRGRPPERAADRRLTAHLAPAPQRCTGAIPAAITGSPAGFGDRLRRGAVIRGTVRLARRVVLSPPDDPGRHAHRDRPG